MKSRIFIMVLFFCLASSISGQVTANAKTDKQSYLIGDFIRFELSVIIDANVMIIWPAAETISNFDIISANPVDTISLQDRLQLKQEIVYSLYDAGNYVFPSVTLQYKKAKDTTSYFITSDSIRITILAVSVDTTQTIKPIKDIIEVEVKSYFWYYVAGGIFLLGAILVALYFIFKRKKAQPAKPVEIKRVSMHQDTLSKLRELESRKLWQQNELKQYYSELTDILRSYMENRFKMKAFESTSDEIIEQLMLMKITQSQSDNINYILDLADLAKFAKSQPGAIENEKSMVLAKEFVESTKPVEQVTDKG